MGDMFFYVLSASISVCFLLVFSHSPSFLLPFLKSCSSTLQHLITFNLFSLFWSFTSLQLVLSSSVSLFASISGLSFSSTISLSLSELSVQTVEYMLSKYTSSLSLRLNKLQQGERKRKAVGQEEGRMGGPRGDEA